MANNSIITGADTSPIVDATAFDRQHADEFYRRLAQLQQQYQQQLAAQSALGRSYDRTIAGTAPSVAGAQLQRGVQQIGADARATASGATGASGALANYGAIQALAHAQAKANADAAELRAREVAAAEAAKANLLNQQQSATNAQSAQSTGAAVDLTGGAMTGAGQQVAANTHENDAERALASGVVNGAGNYLTARSDRDAKTDIKPVAKNDMDDFLKHIAGFSFKYKDGGTAPDEGPGKRVGVMAQDVHAGGPVGRAVSDGHSLDMRNAIGALLAAVAHVNEKIDGHSAA